MKKVLIINGHPDRESYSYALARHYREGLENSSADILQLNLADLDFNPILHYGYREITPLEPDLQKAIDLIKKADHLVWFFPMWWHGSPALLKGFIDRVFLPGVMFKFQKGKAFPDKLLRGKSARIVLTADTPRWYDILFMRSPAVNQFKKGTLQFCGVNPVRLTYISPIKNSTEAFRKKWLEKVKKLGEKML